MLLIFAYLSFAVVAGIIAGSRGRSGFGYFALSLVVSPLIGIILAVALPNLRPSIERAAELADTRDCPHCAERIKKAASICRFCGRDVEPIEIRRLAWPPDPNAPAPSRVPIMVLSAVLVGFLAVYFYFQPQPPAPTPGGSRMEVAAPAPMPAAVPVVEAPTGTLASPKAQPKDAKPKAPAGPLKITPQ